MHHSAPHSPPDVIARPPDLIDARVSLGTGDRADPCALHASPCMMLKWCAAVKRKAAYAQSMGLAASAPCTPMHPCERHCRFIRMHMLSPATSCTSLCDHTPPSPEMSESHVGPIPFVGMHDCSLGHGKPFLPHPPLSPCPFPHLTSRYDGMIFLHLHVFNLCRNLCRNKTDWHSCTTQCTGKTAVHSCHVGPSSLSAR